MILQFSACNSNRRLNSEKDFLALMIFATCYVHLYEVESKKSYKSCEFIFIKRYYK